MRPSNCVAILISLSACAPIETVIARKDAQVEKLKAENDELSKENAKLLEDKKLLMIQVAEKNIKMDDQSELVQIQHDSNDAAWGITDEALKAYRLKADQFCPDLMARVKESHDHDISLIDTLVNQVDNQKSTITDQKEMMVEMENNGCDTRKAQETIEHRHGDQQLKEAEDDDSPPSDQPNAQSGE